GIKAYGAYVPLFRLDKKAIGGKGEKAICNFDEDSITMAVEAISDCLTGQNKSSVDAFYFGTTTSAYQEHSGATTIAMASNLREDVYTAEFANSLRAGTAALRAGLDAVKAGSGKNVLVAAGECRLGAPGSPQEQNIGDGAAALLLSDRDVVATIEGQYSVYNEIIDIWRLNGDRFVNTWEDRFIAEQGYIPTIEKAVKGLMKQMNCNPSDFAKVVFYSMDAKKSVEVGKMLKFDVEIQLTDPLILGMGETGSASPLMLFVSALETAKPGDLILLASYGSGADAFAFRVNENIEKVRGKALGMSRHLASKKVINNYPKYLEWRGLLPKGKIIGPHGAYSAVAAKREYDRSIALQGSKCKACGYVQYPRQRVCVNCQTKDQMEAYGFADRLGKIFTYNIDYITPRAEVPTVTVEVDFDGGGRIQCYMTEVVDTENIAIDLPVKMTFRRNTLWEGIAMRESVCTYFWEAKPLRK
ncbi:MAG: OB-fold domain-containing protein, partial [Spirochaetaceae bacterium]|nr:OB-fold domain-containing protein [Spirochaetaceae bacterium]